MTCATPVKPTYCSTRTAQENHVGHHLTSVCGRKMILLMAVARHTSHARLATETGGHASCSKKWLGSCGHDYEETLPSLDARMFVLKDRMTQAFNSEDSMRCGCV
jgi:hypothetical protein